MLIEDTAAVYFENHTEYTDTVRTPPETHYVSAMKTNRLMLFKETVAVCYKNRMKHINTVWGGGQNIESLNVKRARQTGTTSIFIVAIPSSFIICQVIGPSIIFLWALKYLNW
jgi:hypothetical protein